MMKMNRIFGGREAKPHEFPWLVRIVGGCQGFCGGSLISPTLVLSSYHCTWTNKTPPYDGSAPCDHSNEERVAVLGAHKVNVWAVPNNPSYYTIPIIDVRYPKHGKQVIKEEDINTHDFAILVLKYPAKLSDKVQPICLPKQGLTYWGSKARAAGWGMHKKGSEKQSYFLRTVSLRVSKKSYDHYSFIGTELKKNEKGEYMDPCGGDSGEILYLIMIYVGGRDMPSLISA